MKIAYSSKQLTFEEMKGFLCCLGKDNRGVKLGDALLWDGLDKLYLSKLRNDGCGAKIFMTSENRQELAWLGFQCKGERRGCPDRKKPRKHIDNERIVNSLMNDVEITLGTSKRVNRADDIRAKLPRTAECWTGICHFVKNQTKPMRGHCSVLSEKLPSMRILSIIRLSIGELVREILLPGCSEARMLIA